MHILYYSHCKVTYGIVLVRIFVKCYIEYADRMDMCQISFAY